MNTTSERTCQHCKWPISATNTSAGGSTAFSCEHPEEVKKRERSYWPVTLVKLDHTCKYWEAKSDEKS